MGVEVVGFEMVQAPTETVAEVDSTLLHEKENGDLDKDAVVQEPIKFGSHGEEPVKGDGNEVADAKLPKDAADEWPAPKQIHTFYFPKHRRYDDPKIQAKIDQFGDELGKLNDTKIQIMEELRSKRLEKQSLIEQVRELRDENKQYKSILDVKKKEIEPLQQALGKLRTSNGTGRGGLCSSEEELNDLIYSLQYRIQHESIPLNEEKQILREIKQLEGTREKVVANAAMRAKIQDSMGQKEAIQDQVKLIGVDLDGVKKEQQQLWARINGIEEKVKAKTKEIEALQKEFESVTQKRDKTHETLRKLRGQREEGNALFYHGRSIVNKARDFASAKNVKALEDLSQAEIEKFMSLWSNDKAFRDDYEQKIVPFLDNRQLSRDGRMRNPDEPLVVPPKEPEAAAKANVKRAKEDVKPTPQKDALPPQKVQTDTNKTDSKALEHIETAEEEIPGLEKQQKKPVEKEIDEAKLKELKREEQLVKAKQAMERKKKLAEKSAVKAAIRAQKEAEKKLKEREKKLKKKASASAPANEPEEPVEAVDEVGGEPENVEVNEEAPVTVKENVRREKTRNEKIRFRKQSKGADSLPKAILRRKKSTNYWIWVAPAAFLLFVFLAVCYYLSTMKK